MLATIDWIIIVGFLVLIVAVGLSYTKKAGQDLSNFFLGGRNLPWYIAGISMVATTFAADTPLAVTELVGQGGISNNWIWWSFLAGGMLTTFFFANLWRRAEVLTEVELIEMRYSGKPAAFLRGFKAVYLGLFMNVLIIGWVNLALMTLLEVFFHISSTEALLYTALAMTLVAVYSSLSGLLGVAITDVIQFVIAMTGCIILAVLTLNSEQVGGITGLKASLPAETLNFFPSITSGESVGDNMASAKLWVISIGAFLAHTTIQWWASWYPGAEPGGGGYIAQRMMSAKNEKHAVYATLFFQIAHYCIRPWPWIIVGLCAISLYGLEPSIKDEVLAKEIAVVQKAGDFKDNMFTKNTTELTSLAQKDATVKQFLPQLTAINQRLRELATNDEQLHKALAYTADQRKGYVYAMTDFLPAGLKGLLLVAFFAAYMSTISTQLNWGASYMVNDFYHRFLDPNATQARLVKIARLTTLVLMIIGLLVSTQITSISGVWSFIIECGAGLGLVLILRWYWWRINAWSEIVATIAPFIAFAACRFVFDVAFPESLFITVAFTTVAWLVATYFTQPTDMKKLKAFYVKVRPGGAWGPVQQLTSLAGHTPKLGSLVISWLSAIVMTYAILFAIGKALFVEWDMALTWTGVALISFAILRISLARTKILR